MHQTVIEYINQVQATTALLRCEEILAGLGLLRKAHRLGRHVFICGNGGSASTASHLAVDLGRMTCRKNESPVRAVALTDNVPWLTAVSNDRSYGDCFSEQLRGFLQDGDLVIGISASGNSPNMVRAFEVACDAGVDRLALIGFSGGRLARLATRSIWVDSDDYGIVESVHLVVAHLLVHLLSCEELAPPDKQNVASITSMGAPAEGTDVKGDAPLASGSAGHSVRPVQQHL